MATKSPDWVRSTGSIVVVAHAIFLFPATDPVRFGHRLRCIFSSYNGRVETADVIVAGGGIIGLSAALELARSGFRVRVMERGRAMQEASWAAAGMLAAEDPAHPAELAELAALSSRIYPEFISEVERLSGHMSACAHAPLL